VISLYNKSELEYFLDLDSVVFSGIIITHSAIAQSVERLAVNEDVPGSSPGRGASKINDRPCAGLLFVDLLLATRGEKGGARRREPGSSKNSVEFYA
jgi:hypothetical protein